MSKYNIIKIEGGREQISISVDEGKDTQEIAISIDNKNSEQAQNG